MSNSGPAVESWSFRRNLAGAVFALFAAGAGIAQALDGPAWVKLTFAAIAVLGAIVTLFILLKERAAREVTAKRVRSAVGLDLSHDGDGGRLLVTNRGLHVVRDVEVTAIPADEDWMPETHGVLPRLYSDTGPGVTLTSKIVGGWLHAQVNQLNPGRGVCIARYHEGQNDYRAMDIDINWNDHDDRQRKAHVSTSLKESGPLKLTLRDAS